MSLTRNQLRAARALLALKQEELAALAQIATVTVRRYESGSSVTKTTIEKMRRAVESAGALLIEPGIETGLNAGRGVVLFADRELPTRTRERIANAEIGNEIQRLKKDTDVLARPRGRPRKNRD
jgi:transcriptional regulator with XRE-family HTH domain